MKSDKKNKRKFLKAQLDFLKAKNKMLKQLLMQRVSLPNKFWITKCFKLKRMLKFSWLSKLVLLQNLTQS